MSVAEIAGRWEALQAGIAERVLPLLEDIRLMLEMGAQAARWAARKPRAARRVLRHLQRPPTRGYWARHGVAAARRADHAGLD